MFPTIVEKVEEEEKAAHETARSPPSPLTQLYDGLTLQTRHTWPKFLGDWAYVENAHRNGGSLGSESESETGDGHSLDSIEHDEVFSEESCEKSSEGDPAAFYLSSEDATPGTPDCFNGGVKEMSDDSLNETCSNGNENGSNGTELSINETLSNRNEISSSEIETSNSGMHTGFNDNEIHTARREAGFNETASTGKEISSSGLDNSDNGNEDNVNEADISKIPVRVSQGERTIASEPNNNDAKVHRSKKGFHLPLASGTKSSEVKDNENEEKGKKKKEKDVKKSEEKKKVSEKVRLVKKPTSTDTDKADKHVKKDKASHEKGTKESSGKRKSEKEGLSPKTGDHKESSSPKKGELKESSSKKTDTKEEKSMLKVKDKTKSPPTQKKSSKKSDLKDKKTDSPKRKSESKEKKTCDYINNPDPPILGSARPLVFTNFASKLATHISPVESCDARGDYSHDKPEVYHKQAEESKGSHSDVAGCHDNFGLALVPSPLGDVPFGRYFEEFIFVVCLFTFLSLCIGIPSETFVLVILGMHFFYSMVTIFGLC